MTASAFEKMQLCYKVVILLRAYTCRPPLRSQRTSNSEKLTSWNKASIFITPQNSYATYNIAFSRRAIKSPSLSDYTGNLNYYIGAQIAQTGYIRQRDLEFTQTHVGQKQAVLSRLDQAVDVVVTSLRNQTDGDWEQTFTAVGADDVQNRFGIYLRCAVHFHHHIGQMIYLVKELTRAG